MPWECLTFHCQYRRIRVHKIQLKDVISLTWSRALQFWCRQFSRDILFQFNDGTNCSCWRLLSTASYRIEAEVVQTVWPSLRKTRSLGAATVPKNAQEVQRSLNHLRENFRSRSLRWTRGATSYRKYSLYVSDFATPISHYDVPGILFSGAQKLFQLSNYRLRRN